MTIKEFDDAYGPLPERPIGLVQKRLKKHAYILLLGHALMIGWALWCIGESDYHGAKNALYAIAFWSLLSILILHTDTHPVLARLHADEVVNDRTE